jgi:hypothetical protein
MPASALAVNAPREKPKMKICKEYTAEALVEVKEGDEGAYLIAGKVVCER